jgi:KDEL-tailed cysteine endopeptidase
MKFTIFALAILAICAFAHSEEEYAFEFGRFLEKFDKAYESVEESMHRFSVFRKNLDLIKEHNAAGKSWKLAVNEFADLTWDEFRKAHLGLKKVSVDASIPRFELNLDGLVTIPDSVDWTEKNAVTPIKNQGQCGSCWAFSTTGSVEGAIAIKTGKLVSVSEQQLVDCSTSEGNQGCNGGLMDDAFKYIISNKGLCTESDYPYTAADGSCRTCTPSVQIKSFVDVAQSNLDALKAAVAQQPVAVAIEADQMGFQFYSSGVFSGTCGTNLDHGVLVVGYGSLNGQDFWKVKNSWGASWGANGYILLSRTNGSGPGQCGVAMQPSYPVA